MSTKEHIKVLRLKKGWSQTQLAERAGLSQTTISTLENRTNRPDAVTLNQVAKALGVTVDALLKEEVIR